MRDGECGKGAVGYAYQTTNLDATDLQNYYYGCAMQRESPLITRGLIVDSKETILHPVMVFVSSFPETGEWQRQDGNMIQGHG